MPTFSMEPDLFDAPQPDMETLICGLKYGASQKYTFYISIWTEGDEVRGHTAYITTLVLFYI
jgi:hypothetical protein